MFHHLRCLTVSYYSSSSDRNHCSKAAPFCTTQYSLLLKHQVCKVTCAYCFLRVARFIFVHISRYDVILQQRARFKCRNKSVAKLPQMHWCNSNVNNVVWNVKVSGEQAEKLSTAESQRPSRELLFLFFLLCSPRTYDLPDNWMCRMHRNGMADRLQPWPRLSRTTIVCCSASSPLCATSGHATVGGIFLQPSFPIRPGGRLSRNERFQEEDEVTGRHVWIPGLWGN